VLGGGSSGSAGGGRRPGRHAGRLDDAAASWHHKRHRRVAVSRSNTLIVGVRTRQRTHAVALDQLRVLATASVFGSTYRSATTCRTAPRYGHTMARTSRSASDQKPLRRDDQRCCDHCGRRTLAVLLSARWLSVPPGAPRLVAVCQRCRRLRVMRLVPVPVAREPHLRVRLGLPMGAGGRRFVKVPRSSAPTQRASPPRITSVVQGGLPTLGK